LWMRRLESGFTWMNLDRGPRSPLLNCFKGLIWRNEGWIWIINIRLKNGYHCIYLWKSSLIFEWVIASSLVRVMLISQDLLFLRMIILGCFIVSNCRDHTVQSFAWINRKHVRVMHGNETTCSSLVRKSCKIQEWKITPIASRRRN